MSINLKIHNFNDDPYTIIPLFVCVCVDEFSSTSGYGCDLDQSCTIMDSGTVAHIVCM